MEKYTKPTLKIIEHVTEERLAGSGCIKNDNNKNSGCSIFNNGINNEVDEGWRPD